MNVQATTDSRRDEKNSSFNHEPGQVVDKFPNYNMKILLGNFRELFGMSSGYQAPCLHEYAEQDMNLTTYLGPDGFGGLVVSMLASGTQVCGFKPGRSRWIFTDVKILSMPSSRGEVKESVPCHSFVACQRT